MLAFVSTYAALLVPHLGRPAVQRPACRSAASRMLEEADIPEAFKRKSKRPAPVPQILLVDREGDEVRFVMEGGKLSLYVDDELFCGAIDTLTYSRDDGVVSVEDEVCAHQRCTDMACTWRAHGVHMACVASRQRAALPSHRQEVRAACVPCGGAGHRASTLAVYGLRCKVA